MVIRQAFWPLGATILFPFSFAAPGLAQDTQFGSTAEVPGGEVGQRQTREQAAPNVQSVERINSRVRSRIQNRIQNRIDENYNLQSDTTSSYKVADEQSRAATRRKGPK